MQIECNPCLRDSTSHMRYMLLNHNFVLWFLFFLSSFSLYAHIVCSPFTQSTHTSAQWNVWRVAKFKTRLKRAFHSHSYNSRRWFSMLDAWTSPCARDMWYMMCVWGKQPAKVGARRMDLISCVESLHGIKNSSSSSSTTTSSTIQIVSTTSVSWITTKDNWSKCSPHHIQHTI